MVYKFENWSLYKTVITHPNGEKEPVYFFSTRKPIRGNPCSVPKGYDVLINKRIGLPYLVFKDGGSNERC